MPYGTDFRSRVLELAAEGEPLEVLIQRFKVARSTICHWKKPPVAYAQGKPGPKTAHRVDRAALAELVRAQPDLMLQELAPHLNAKVTTIHANLKALGLRRKKTLCYSQAFNAKNREARKAYLKRRDREQQRNTPLVYLDETGFAATPHRTHGSAVKGRKVHGKCSAHQRPRTNVLGASLNNRRLAPLLFEGTCHTRLFNAGLAQELLPRLITGSIIVMDNASFHKSARTRELIDEVGCELLYLPPYSPDLNPIEKMWSNLKRAWKNQEGPLDELIASFN